MIARFFFLIAVFALLPVVARAQQPAWQFGAFGGWQFGAPTGIDRASAEIRTFGTSGEGKSWENSALGGLQYDEALGQRTALSFALSYAATHGEFKSEFFADSTGLVNVFRLVEDVKSATAAASLNYRIPNYLFASAGLSLTGRVSTSAIERTEAVYESRAFDTIASAAGITTSPISVGVPISVGFHLPVTSWLSLTPSINGLIDLSELSRSGGARALRGGASIGLMVHPSSDTEATVVEVPTPPLVAPTEVRVYFTDNGIATHRITASYADTSITRYIEIPATPTFTAAQLRMQLAYADSSFELAQLNRRPVAAVYRHYFDILAARLREGNTTVRISLSGKPTEVAEAGEALNEFFARRHVPAARFTITEHITTSPMVRIGVDSASAAIAPLVQQWSERAYILPTLSIEKFISTPHGLRTWTLTLLEDRRVIKAWSAEDGPGPIVIPPLSLAPHKLVALISVIDSLGEHFASDSLKLEIPEADTTDRGPATRQEFAVIADRTASSVWHSALMTELHDRVGRSTHVRVRRLTTATPIAAALGDVLAESTIPPRVDISGDEPEDPAIFSAYEVIVFP